MVAHRGATSVNIDGTSSLNLSLAAASAQAGDLAVVVAAWTNGGAVLTAPVGWTAEAAHDVSTTLSTRLFHKVLDAADITADTVTISSSAFGKAAAAMIAASEPGDVLITSTLSDVNDTTQGLAAIDPAVTSLVVGLVGLNYNAAGLSATAPAGWTERADTITTNPSGRRAGAYAATLDVISDAAVPASTVTTNSAAHAGSWTVAIGEAAGGTPGVVTVAALTLPVDVTEPVIRGAWRDSAPVETLAITTPTPTVTGGTIAPDIVTVPALVVSVDTTAPVVTGGTTVPATVAVPLLVAAIDTPTPAVAAGTSVPATVTAPALVLDVTTTTPTLSAPANLTVPTLEQLVTLAAVEARAAAIVTAPGLTLATALTAPSVTSAPTIEPRDITILAATLPVGAWETTATAGGWSATATEDRWTSTPPTIGWSTTGPTP